MKAWLLLSAALGLDALVGDPRGLPHPTRAMGALAARVEALLRPAGRAEGRARAYAAGALGWVLVVGGSVLAAWTAREAVAAALAALWPYLGLEASTGRALGGGIVSVYLVYAAIAPRDLAAHALRVARALEGRPGGGERLAEGRKAVAMIVGRDVERLDEAGVVRAAVESVAESAVDGVAAPLLWALLLGPLGAVAYRAANTLDSMWGHRDERYLRYGRVAARADDLLTWPAARLAFAASIAAVFLAGLAAPARYDARRALAVGLRDRRKHASPNSAWLEASFAGALGLGLAGPAWYGGELADKPRIGDALREPETADIRRAVLLMLLTTLVFAAIGAAAALALGR